MPTPTHTFSVTGMTCSSCVAYLESKLQLEGVENVSVSLLLNRVEIKGGDKDTLFNVIKSAGFVPTYVLTSDPSCSATGRTGKGKKQTGETPSEKLAKQARSLQLRLLVALVFAVPIFVIAMILPFFKVADQFFMKPVINSATVMGVTLFALSTPVQFGVGWIFISNALIALKNRHANMSVLVAIGSLSAYFYSFVSLIINFSTISDNQHVQSMNEHFFETASTLITVVIFGQYLEHVAKGHTSSALSALMTLQPSTATVVNITPQGTQLTSNLTLRANQQDDDLFSQLQGYLPFFSYHYTSSSSISTSLSRITRNPSEIRDDSVVLVVGANSVRLTRARKYSFDQLLSQSGIHMTQLDDTRDVNQYILSDSMQQVETEGLEEGMLVKIIRGSKVPADCMLVLGTCYVDDSVVTGESIQRKKIPGSSLIGGTVVTEGVCVALILRTGEDTTLAQIITLVEQAQTAKAPISAFADQISRYFVPTIISLSLLTFIVWFLLGYVFNITYKSWNEHAQTWDSMGVHTHAIIRAVAVMVIACPCALGLATPTAVMVATGVGAANGVLIKGGAALEAAANLDTIVFDKTGTLTKGKPQVVCSMIFSPKHLHNRTAGQSASRTGNQNPTLLNAAEDQLANHLFFVSDEVHLRHYSSIIEQSIQTSGTESVTFGKVEICSLTTSAPQYPLFNKDSLSNTDDISTPFSHYTTPSAFSPELNQTLRLLFTTLSNAESNSEHFIGRCIVKYLKQQSLTLSQNHLASSSSKLVDLSDQNITMHSVVTQTGRGVSAQISFPQSYLPQHISTQTHTPTQPTSIIIGNSNWLVENDVKIPFVIENIATQLESQGLTVVFSAIENMLVGLFAIGDDVKPEAFEVVRYLQAVMNYDVFVLTGDNARNAKYLAQRLNIPQNQVHAHLSPTQKLTIIKQLQRGGTIDPNTEMTTDEELQLTQSQNEYRNEQNRFNLKDILPYLPIIGPLVTLCCKTNKSNRDEIQLFETPRYGAMDQLNPVVYRPRSVCFIGDGINDSPALAQAQVGIAIGAGTDVAIESADMVLVRNDLRDLLSSLVLANTTLDRIKSNFGWSLLYNVCSIPIAAGVFFPLFSTILPPEVAAFAMGFSSVSVILSSLMLKLFRAPVTTDTTPAEQNPDNHIITIGESQDDVKSSAFEDPFLVSFMHSNLDSQFP